MARRSRHARRPRPSWPRGPSVVIAVVLLALALPDRAAAHANLVSADPQPLASTDGVPRQVQLHFGQPTVPDSRDVVTVTSPSGTDVALGRAVVNGLGVAQRLGPSPERGWYTVRFHVAFVD